MKHLFSIVFLTVLLMAIAPPSFLSKQLQFPRVRQAHQEKYAPLVKLLQANAINDKDFDLYLRAFKNEQKLEVYVKNQGTSTYKLIKTYDFCATSGVLGPKRRSGDKQIPEGFYVVNLFNPQSKYHLSFQLNYPNASDLVFADKLNPGNEIFIHGECATIGCIPVGNDNIKELYLLTALAKNANGRMDVHIFPTHFTAAGKQMLTQQGSANAAFWESLEPVYAHFEATKQLPTIKVGSNGFYQVAK